VIVSLYGSAKETRASNEEREEEGGAGQGRKRLF